MFVYITNCIYGRPILFGSTADTTCHMTDHVGHYLRMYFTFNQELPEEAKLARELLAYCPEEIREETDLAKWEHVEEQLEHLGGGTGIGVPCRTSNEAVEMLREVIQFQEIEEEEFAPTNVVWWEFEATFVPNENSTFVTGTHNTFAGLNIFNY